MSYYQKELECLPRKELLALQEEKLLKQINHVYNHVPYYRKLMEARGLVPADFTSRKDLTKLPFLTKDDLRDSYPDGLLGVPKKDCVRIHSTSGTTGKRVIAFYTQNDVDLWEDCCARALSAAGIGDDDVIQIAYGFGLFTGGFGVFGGAHKVGAMTLPMSSGNTDRQLQFMTDLEATALCCTPSYAAYLGESINVAGLKDRIRLKAGIFGAEAWSEEMRRDLEQTLGIKAYDIYGLTEISGPGVAYECHNQKGMHINEDHFIAEIIDPETKEVLPMGSKGELVFSSLDKEAFPLLRYRTKDITYLTDEECSCGRTFVRMHRPMGRSDDMMIVKGVNVFPSQIEAVLLQQGLTSNYQIVVDRVNHSDTIDVNVEMTPELFSDVTGSITQEEKRISGALKSILGIYCAVHMVEPRSIVRSEGKAVRVIDKRKI